MVVTNENCHKNVLTVCINYALMTYKEHDLCPFSVSGEQQYSELSSECTCKRKYLLPSHQNKDEEWFVLVAFPYDR